MAGGRLSRVTVVAMMGLAASAVGLPLVMMSAFLAPIGSAVLLVRALMAGSVRQPRLSSEQM